MIYAVLAAILRELRAIRRRLVPDDWQEIDLTGIEETDEERRMAILMRAL